MKPKQFFLKNTRSLPNSNSLTKCGFSSPNCTRILDSSVQCDLEPIELSFYVTVNPKFVSKCRGLDDSSQKGFSTPSAPTKHASERCTSTGNIKTIMANN